MTIQELVTDALEELGVVSPGDEPAPEDSQTALKRLNRLLDNWNADRRAVYANQFSTHTLTPALQPHTIGTSSPTFSVTQRPVSIERANLVISDVRYGLNLRNAEWWAGLSDYTLTGEIPTDLYYEPAWPNGQLYLWPVPTTAHTLELLTRVLLASVTLATTFALPPGYQDALTLTLAEGLSVPFDRPVPSELAQGARTARARIFANNDPDPHISVADVGLPGSFQRGGFDYRIGR